MFLCGIYVVEYMEVVFKDVFGYVIMFVMVEDLLVYGEVVWWRFE